MVPELQIKRNDLCFARHIFTLLLILDDFYANFFTEIPFFVPHRSYLIFATLK